MSNSNSSFHSALSTPDSSTFENTLVDSTIKHLLTRDNLAVHSSARVGSKNSFYLRSRIYLCLF